MTLLDSLLDAILRLDGEALIMHAGEKPYVVLSSASMSTFRGPLSWGQVELSSRPLTGDAVLGMLGQMLSPEQRHALDDLGAIEEEIDAPGESGERFVVTAARGGDDVWVEVRRRAKTVEAPAAAQPSEPAAAVAPPPSPVPEAIPEPEPQPIVQIAAETAEEGIHDITAVDADLSTLGEVTEGPVFEIAPPAFTIQTEASRVPDEDEQEAAVFEIEPEAVFVEATPGNAAPIAAAPDHLVEQVDAAQPVVHLTEQQVGQLAQQQVGQFAEQKVAEIAEQKVTEAAEQKVGEIAEQKVGEIAAQKVGEIAARTVAQVAEQVAQAAEHRVTEAAERQVAEIADQRVSKFAEQRVSEFADRRVSEFAEQRVSEFADRRVSEFAEQRVSEFADRRVSEFADRRVSEFADRRVSESAERHVSEVAERRVAAAAEQKVGEIAAQHVAHFAEQKVAQFAEQKVAEAARQQVAAAAEQRVGEIAAQKVGEIAARQVAQVAEQVAHAAEQRVTEAAEQRVAAAAQKVGEIAERRVGEIAAQQVAQVAEQKVAQAAERQVAEIAGQRVSEVAEQRVTAAAEQRVAEIAGQKVTEAAEQQVAEIAGQKVTQAAEQQVAEIADQRVTEAARLRVAAVAEQRVAAIAEQKVTEVAEQRVAELASRKVSDAAEQQVAELAGQKVAELAGQKVAELAGQKVAELAERKISEIAERMFGEMLAARKIADLAEERVAELAEQKVTAVPSVVVPHARPAFRLQPSPAPAAEASKEASLIELLRTALGHGASTVYAVVDTRPMMRIEGRIALIGTQPSIAAGDVERFIFEFAPREFVGETAPEWTCIVPDVGRVRCVTFHDYSGAGLIFHLPAGDVSTADELGIPAELQALSSEADGLVVVAGPRSSGKSTLLTAFVDLINRTRYDHVITIESQIRKVHEKRLSFISQREVRGDGDAIAAAARAALREGPDVLVIEDLRSPEALTVALDAARAGRLVFGSISACTAPAAIQRLIDAFPADRRPPVRASLAGSLRAVIAQLLVPKVAGGRIAAREVLLSSPAVRKLVLDGAIEQLPIAIESGRSLGMKTMVDSLGALVRDGVVELIDACAFAPDRGALVSALERDGIDVTGVERRA